MRSGFDFPYLRTARAVTWAALLLLVLVVAGCGQAESPAPSTTLQRKTPQATKAAGAPGPSPQIEDDSGASKEKAPPVEAPAGEGPVAPESAPGILPTLAPSDAEPEWEAKTDGASGSAEKAEVPSARAAPHPTPPPSYPDRARQYEPVTAGVVDDNEQWHAYLDYRERHRFLPVHDRDVSERYFVQVWDRAGRPVHDALVRISVGQQLVFEGRSDAGGRLLFHPRALNAEGAQWQASHFEVTARKGQVSQYAIFDRYEDEYWTITLPDAPVSAETRLDLLFLIDATGSMQDEIDKLKATLGDIADQIARLPEQPDVRYGLVAYRDRGDEFVVRAYDFTPDLGAFQRTMASLRAAGGGDDPESLNEALARALNDLSWRRDDTVRMILLVADAPPHLDYGEQFAYDDAMIAAVGRGIKIFPVGASGLSEEGEYIFRQLAQFTGGKFVFLTYAHAGRPGSGPGAETDHDVANYSVDTLDRLVVRLVREELAKLPRAVATQPRQIAQVQALLPAPVGMPGMTGIENGGRVTIPDESRHFPGNRDPEISVYGRSLPDPGER